VPLAFFWPDEIAPGTSDSPVQLVDVLPTLLDLAGIEIPEHVDGRSLVPALRGDTLPAQPAFAELHQTTLECQHWPEPPCDLGRYAVFTEQFDYESSAVPLYERLYVRDETGRRVDVASSQPAELERHRALLRGYLGGQEPAGVLELGPQPEIDELTRDRLRGLGYLE
jgi:arylsulfatase A-like enzyme